MRMHACIHTMKHDHQHGQHACIYACLHACMNACVCASMYVCIHIPMHACMHAWLQWCLYGFVWFLWFLRFPLVSVRHNRLHVLRIGRPDICTKNTKRRNRQLKQKNKMPTPRTPREGFFSTSQEAKKAVLSLKKNPRRPCPCLWPRDAERRPTTSENLHEKPKTKKPKKQKKQGPEQGQVILTGSKERNFLYFKKVFFQVSRKFPISIARGHGEDAKNL